MELFRKKSPDHLMAEASAPSRQLKRTLGPFALTCIGIGAIGFVAFIDRKRTHLWKPMLLGIELMIYPYFINDDRIMLIVGISGSTALFSVRE